MGASSSTSTFVSASMDQIERTTEKRQILSYSTVSHVVVFVARTIGVACWHLDSCSRIMDDSSRNL